MYLLLLLLLLLLVLLLLRTEMKYKTCLTIVQDDNDDPTLRTRQYSIVCIRVDFE
jgi:hypothetical protein